MRQIETRIFAAGMPVAALMEKVGGLIARRIQALLKAEGSSATSSVRDLTDRRKREEGKNLVNSQSPVIGVLVGRDTTAAMLWLLPANCTFKDSK